MIISANKPKKKVCKAVAHNPIKVTSQNLFKTPTKNKVANKTAINISPRAIGVKTLIGLKNKESLVTNFTKFTKSKARIEDFPCHL